MSNPARRSTELDVKADGNGNIQALCMACDSAECNFTPRVMERRPVGDYDILLDIKYWYAKTFYLYSSIPNLWGNIHSNRSNRS